MSEHKHVKHRQKLNKVDLNKRQTRKARRNNYKRLNSILKLFGSILKKKKKPKPTAFVHEEPSIILFYFVKGKF